MRELISAESIRSRVAGLAAEISRDYPGTPILSDEAGQRLPVTLVGILSGSLIFLADLVRQLTMPTRIGFVRARSYPGAATTPGPLEILPGLVPDVTGRDVILLDDILDTGRTLTQVVSFLRRQQPRSLKVAVLLRKTGRQEVPFEPDYCGFEIPNLFVVGYGLDYNDDYRQLPFIGILEELS